MNLKKKWIIGFIMCFILLAFFLPKFLKSKDIPVNLHGVWENADPNYHNRYFLLDKNAVGFGTGDGKVDWYAVVSVDETKEGNNILYTIEYQKGKGALLKKSFYYYPAKSGRIKFKNQKEIEWFLTNS